MAVVVAVEVGVVVVSVLAAAVVVVAVATQTIEDEKASVLRSRSFSESKKNFSGWGTPSWGRPEVLRVHVKQSFVTCVRQSIVWLGVY